MRELKATVVLALAGLLFYDSAVANAQEYQPPDQQTSPQSAACFPACRAGYVCNQGVCVSLCNPPCGPAEVCTADGECLMPPPPPPMAAPPPPPPPVYTIERASWFRWGYGHVGGIVSPFGAGSFYLSGNHADHTDFTTKFSGGLHLSGYWAASARVQLGAYFNFIRGKIELTDTGDESVVEQIGVGFSVKVGGQVGDRVWLGFVGDLGYYGLSFDPSDRKYEGIEISPRFHVDVLVVRAGEFKMGFFASAGPSIVPFAAVNNRGGDDFRVWLVTAQFRLGLTFGA